MPFFYVLRLSSTIIPIKNRSNYISVTYIKLFIMNTDFHFTWINSSDIPIIQINGISLNFTANFFSYLLNKKNFYEGI